MQMNDDYGILLPPTGPLSGLGVVDAEIPQLVGGDIPDSIVYMSPEQKADLYNKLLALGNTNEAIRRRAEYKFGPQSDADWNALRAIAAERTYLRQAEPNYAPPGSQLLPPTGFVPQPGDGIGPGVMPPDEPGFVPRIPDAPVLPVQPVFEPEPDRRQPEVFDYEAERQRQEEEEMRRQRAREAAFFELARKARADAETKLIGMDIPDDLPGKLAAEKAMVYLTLLDLGNTNEKIRARAEFKFGPIPDADWIALQNLATAQRAAAIAEAAAKAAAQAAADARDSQRTILSVNPQSEGTVLVDINVDQADTAAATASNAANIAKTSADAAVTAADAGDAAATRQASETAINAGNAAQAAADTANTAANQAASQAGKTGVKYFDFPAGIENFSLQDKAKFYNAKRAAGFTDAQIRSTTDFVFGPQADSDWAMLTSAAASIRTATVTPGTTPGVTPAPGGGAGTLLLAVAAAYILGA